jgi:hypothetical protein
VASPKALEVEEWSCGVRDIEEVSRLWSGRSSGSYRGGEGRLDVLRRWCASGGDESLVPLQNRIAKGHGVMRQREEMKGKARGRARAHWIDGEGSNSPQYWNFFGEESLSIWWWFSRGK